MFCNFSHAQDYAELDVSYKTWNPAVATDLSVHDYVFCCELVHHAVGSSLSGHECSQCEVLHVPAR